MSFNTEDRVTVDYLDHCGSDLSVVNAARVSFSKAIEGDELQWKDIRLIKYLADHKHFSPFNHTFLSVRVKAPLFVARQLVKHEYMPWNEVSRRYVKSSPSFYLPSRWRLAAEDVKQGSSEETFKGVFYPDNPHKSLQQVVYDHTRAAFSLYEEMIRQGVCPEQARMILPQNMFTEWIWSGTVGAFAKMLSLRLPPDTQEETRTVATFIAWIMEKYFPFSTEALLRAYRNE